MPPRDRAQRSIEARQLIQAGKCLDGTYHLNVQGNRIEVIFRAANRPDHEGVCEISAFREIRPVSARVYVKAMCRERDRMARERAKRATGGEPESPSPNGRYYANIDDIEAAVAKLGDRYPYLFPSWFRQGEKLDMEKFREAAALVGDGDPELAEVVESIAGLGKSDRREVRRRLVGRFEG